MTATATHKQDHDAQHTPGPWSIFGRTRIVGNPVVLSERSTTYNGVAADVQNPADAALIKAAPNLLAALKLIMAGVAGCQKEPHWEAARAAIAEAESI